MDAAKFGARFGPSLARAQRIDAFNRIRPDMEADDTPIMLSVMRDYCYANPPFEHVNDHVGAAPTSDSGETE